MNVGEMYKKNWLTQLIEIVNPQLIM